MIVKIVMVMNQDLPLRLVANTTAVLGISLSKMFQQDIAGEMCNILTAVRRDDVSASLYSSRQVIKNNLKL